MKRGGKKEKKEKGGRVGPRPFTKNETREPLFLGAKQQKRPSLFGVFTFFLNLYDDNKKIFGCIIFPP